MKLIHEKNHPNGLKIFLASILNDIQLNIQVSTKGEFITNKEFFSVFF